MLVIRAGTDQAATAGLGVRVADGVREGPRDLVVLLELIRHALGIRELEPLHDVDDRSVVRVDVEIDVIASADNGWRSQMPVLWLHVLDDKDLSSTLALHDCGDVLIVLTPACVAERSA